MFICYGQKAVLQYKYITQIITSAKYINKNQIDLKSKCNTKIHKNDNNK